MHGEDLSEKTSIVSGDTFSGTLKAAETTPPALVVLMGPTGYVGRQWSLTQNEYVVGRNPDSSIFVDDRSVSRSHASLSVNGSEVSIQDLGSSNKTAINNVALEPMVLHKLQNNDQVKFGNVIMKFLERGNLEAAANRQLSDKAEKDALTGAFNKGALLQRGPEVVKRAELLKEPLSILMFDLDHFKKINDTYGHAAGDYVLREVSMVVQNKMIRSNDYFARYGGEEFVLLLSGTPQKNAMEIAERVRATIEAQQFIFEKNKIVVTTSVGVATRTDESDWLVILDRADRALYQSKQGGRNRVSFGV